MKQYIQDDEPAGRSNWTETNWDIETRLDYEVGPQVDDAVGTSDRGNINGTALAFGTVEYFGSASHIRPSETEIDVWISCTEYGYQAGPWEATNYVDTTGYFSKVIYVDDALGLDTYDFTTVEEDAGSGGSDLSHETHSDTYIADRLNVTITADDTTPANDGVVNFALTVEYDYDDTNCTTYTIQIARNGSTWYVFTNGNKTLFNDTNSAVAYLYTITSDGAGVSETTHGLSTANTFLNNTESVTWSAEATTTTTLPTTTAIPTDTSIFYELFLSLEMWGYLGPIALVVIGYVLTKKDNFLGVLWFVVECLFVARYLALVDATPDYWWHIFILLLGGLFTCVYPLLNRK